MSASLFCLILLLPCCDLTYDPVLLLGLLVIEAHASLCWA